MDKETGEAILVDGKEIKAEATFTPEKSSGTVNVDFTFDEGQTVKLVAPTKEAVKKTENKTTIPKNTGIVQTGDSYRMYVLAAGAVVLVVVGGFVFFKKNKKKDNKK